MEKEPANQQESLWRRSTTKVSPNEQVTPAEVELELRLTDALSRLKDTPVPSNFTARVLAEIDREERQTANRPHRRWRWNFLPRLVGTAAVLLLAAFAVEHHDRVSHRRQMAETLASVADVHSVPSVDALNNFEAIEAMGQHAHADEELLALAQ